MSLAGYLFGNVDEHGRLDNDLDEDLRETLQHVDSDVFSKIFSSDTLGLGVEKQQEKASKDHTGGDNDSDQEEEQDEDDDDDTVDTEQILTKSIPTVHSSDAVDYSDFDETVPDDQIYSDKYYKRGMGIFQQQKSTLPRSRLHMVSDNYDEEEEEEEEHSSTVSLPPPPPTTSTTLTTNKNTTSSITTLKLPCSPSFMSAPPSPSSKSLTASISSPTTATAYNVPSSSPASLVNAIKASTTKQNDEKVIDIKELFPAFEKNKILKFSDLFMTNIKRRSKLRPTKKVTFGEGVEYEISRDDQAYFNRTSKADRLRWKMEQVSASKRRKLDIEVQDDDIHRSLYSDSDGDQSSMDESDEETKKLRENLVKHIDNDKLYHSVVLDSWEDQIIWGSDEDESMLSRDNQENKNVEIKHTNNELEEGSWLSAIRWDREKLDPKFMKINLDLNDPHMLFDCEEVEATKAQLVVPKHVKKGRKPLPRPIPKIPIIYNTDTEPHSKLPLNRFNLSNDKFYDSLYIGRLVRVRQTLGELVVSHALPALKLHPALYKTKLTKAELRSFHRPLFQPPLGEDIVFSRVKAIKRKKKDKKKPSSEFMRTTKDISLKDTSSFVLLEYSEEHPPIISNPGMGALIINYYRKTEPKDEYIPTNDIGEPFVLDIGDTSPFMTFGNVEPGQNITVLYNNLIRAPLFRHESKHSDFLLVKSTYKGTSKYFLREIPAIFTIGQTYPVQEVPGPHSRKVTTTVKNRLQVVAYRLIKRNPQHRLKMSKLAQRFPEYSDIQIRQRLKEFLEFHRQSKVGGGGYWKARGNGGMPPDEEELRKMASPEMVCLYESMLVGERHLQDLGYGDVNDEDEGGDGDTKLEVEQQLAPWFSTRNFINASQGKAMLKLYGAGDPTGRGEGFSFIRVSMKDIFLRAGESAEEKLAQIEARPKSAHRYNVAEQQQIYREEIARIWKAQLDALSNPEEPTLSDHDEESEIDEQEPQSPYMSPSPATPSYRRYDRATSEIDDDDISVTGSLSSRTSYHMNNPNKHLVIRRLMRQPNGEKTWQQEIIRDPIVIKSYLRQRQMIEEEATTTEALEPTDDAEKNARMKKRIQDQLAKLKRNAERRRQRQLTKQAGLAENPVLGLIRGKRGEGAMRRCGNCGQLGHMKTNKNCPMFYIVNGQQNGSSTPQTQATTPSTPMTPSIADNMSFVTSP
ncbi:uncharacterized protein BX664DRAFT_377911 [Halteromyces radiatus]|uniref:uncharacterized protein n=1 Tax=Halteromyces radiatus TaxID=101107 RepID=UPI0022206B56|nr:uncharacterized protein BX664DRAFT_377911 [Halteromyces radiatus]KAI8096715.1 hypothetical protein BX664DRAFT_377911 [Halteromyces radiatus]